MNFSDLTLEQWIDIGFSIGLLLATVFLGRWIIKVLFGRVLRRFTSFTKNTLDDAILDAISAPLYWLALIYAFQFTHNRLSVVFELLQFDLDQVYFVLFSLVGFIAAWRLICEHFYMVWGTIGFNGRDRTWRAIASFLQARRFHHPDNDCNYHPAGLLQRRGQRFGNHSGDRFIGDRAGCAGYAGGYYQWLRDHGQTGPIRIGDRIEIQDLDTWGDVVDIGLRSTRIRTRDNRMVIVPNSVIGKSLIVNYSYPDSQYRIEIHVGVGYGTDIEEARKVLIEAVSKVEGVLSDHPVEALFLEFGDSALIFRVRWWLDSYVDTRRMFDSVNTAMYNALNEAGIEIPFPQRVVMHKVEPSDRNGIIEVFHGKKQ